MDSAQPHDLALLTEIVATQEAISTAAFDLDGVMHEVVEQSRRLTRADAAVLETVEGDELVYRAVAGTAEPYLGIRLKASASLSGHSARTGKIVLCDDSEADPRVDLEAVRKVGARSMLIVPLRHGDVVRHVLKVYCGRRSAFGEHERCVLQILAASLGAALVRAELLETLSRANQELRTLDRLKDEFVALASHELRTPLTSITGYTDALLRGRAGALSDGQRALLDVVRRNTSRLASLVADLLLVAQADAGRLAVSLELETLRLADLAVECLRAAAPEAHRAGIDLALDADGEGHVRGDRVRLGQVLDNLLANALKFTPRGGRVAVRVRSEEGSVVVEVSDTGPGIPVAEQRKLFDRFFRASIASDEGLPGSGLGLAIVKTLVELHGGTVEVKSSEGTGSTFRVRLPLHRAGCAAA